eukprot:4752502-Heterocapsa_arctica.AAC.1
MGVSMGTTCGRNLQEQAEGNRECQWRCSEETCEWQSHFCDDLGHGHDDDAQGRDKTDQWRHCAPWRVEGIQF